jgi:FixJ family two-component response regulator
VLVDIVLEGLNGLDFCRVIKQLSPRTAVVMISGKMDPGIGRNAWASGASAFLAKPFDLSDVTDVVEQSVYKFRQSVA